MPARTKLIAEFAIVVDLAVEREDVAAIVREHRLMTTGRRIDNRKPSMPQTRTPSGRIDRRGNPNTLIVTPAMLNALEHSANESLRLEPNNSSNPTHRKPIHRLH